MVETEVAERNIGIKLDSAGTSTQCSIVDSIQQILDSESNTQCSIHRVHKRFRKINPYKPEVVSIGPFHYGLETIDKNHKLRYVGELLLSMRKVNRKSLKENWLECVGRVVGFQDEARKCYAETIKLSNEKFVEILVTDGLFIIELFRIWAGLGKKPPNDTFSSNSGGISSLLHDLLLLENQIPMVILKCLMDVQSIKVCVSGYSLQALSVRFFLPLMHRCQSEQKMLARVYSYDAKHLLDLVRKTFEPQSISQPKEMTSYSIPCATELKRSGVKFVKGTSNNILDIKFKDGILEIPRLVIVDTTDTLLRNLIAFEQQVSGVDNNYISSYAYMMDGLINTAEDVKIFRKAGIIDHMLGSDKDVADLFNKLCCGVNISKFHYSELYNELITYYKAPWYQRIATTKSFLRLKPPQLCLG